jgi:hypothetical protein
MAGSLHHLGLSVPGPHFGANPSNPKGFFESKWAVRFHKRIAAAARIDDFDSRPDALERARAAVTPEQRVRLARFLERISAEHDQVVVKDPRSVWAQQLWRDVAAEVGLGIRYISMLRHPAEVVGSRTTYYVNSTDEAARLRYQTVSVARWVNSSLITERETRGEGRAFVQYADLLEDWRGVFGPLAAHLGLRLDGDLASGTRHPLDDFIDPALRRHKVTWDEIDIPDGLRDVAQGVWESLVRLTGESGVSDEASAEFDTHLQHYTRLYREAVAISRDAIAHAKDEGRRAGAQEAHARQEENAGQLEDRALRDVSGRELIRTAGQRVARRLRRT